MPKQNTNCPYCGNELRYGSEEEEKHTCSQVREGHKVYKLVDKTKTEEEIRTEIYLIIEGEMSKLVEDTEPIIEEDTCKSCYDRATVSIDFEKVMVNLKARIDKLLNENQAVLVYKP